VWPFKKKSKPEEYRLYLKTAEGTTFSDPRRFATKEGAIHMAFHYLDGGSVFLNGEGWSHPRAVSFKIEKKEI